MPSPKNATLKFPENAVEVGVIGRILRTLLGLYQLYFVISVLPLYDYFMSHTLPTNLKYWAFVVWAFLVLNPVINIGFMVKWRRRPQIVFLITAALATIFNFWQYGNLWGAPLNFLIFIMVIYVHTHLGIAHILSGIIATPGCEMRAFSHLKAILTKGKSEAHICPGIWDKFDKWEANKKN